MRPLENGTLPSLFKVCRRSFATKDLGSAQSMMQPAISSFCASLNLLGNSLACNSLFWPALEIGLYNLTRSPCVQARLAESEAVVSEQSSQVEDAQSVIEDWKKAYEQLQAEVQEAKVCAMHKAPVQLQ